VQISPHGIKIEQNQSNNKIKGKVKSKNKINKQTDTDNIDWRGQVLIPIKQRLASFKSQGITPTLRTMYYNLVSTGVIPNTKNSYKGLSRFTAKLRKNGELPMDCFADNSRRIEDINDTYFTPEEHIDDAIDSLKNATAYYRDTIPRWYKQPEYTEVWTEKDAMVGIFKSVLADRQVRIVPNKGFTGMGFVHENLSRLALIQ
jgi:hypothetical protein